jgi:uncharacterized protein (TIGR00369 family)
MKQELTQRFSKILNEASDQDLHILDQLMEGLQRKQLEEGSTYLSSSLLLERTVTDTSCTVTIPITPYIYNALGIPHGGILAGMMDTAMGILANHSLSEGFGAVTTNLSINYLAIGTGEQLHATAHYAHKGRRTMVIESVVTDNTGTKLAIATGSFFIVSTN